MSKRYHESKAAWIGEQIDGDMSRAAAYARAADFTLNSDEEVASTLIGYLQLLKLFDTADMPLDRPLQYFVDTLGAPYLDILAEELRDYIEPASVSRRGLTLLTMPPTVEQLEHWEEEARRAADNVENVAVFAFEALHEVRKRQRPHQSRVPNDALWQITAEETDVHETKAAALRQAVDYLLWQGDVKDGDVDTSHLLKELWKEDTLRYTGEELDEDTRQFISDIGGQHYVDALKAVLFDFDGRPKLEDFVELIQEQEEKASKLYETGRNAAAMFNGNIDANTVGEEEITQDEEVR